MRSNLVLIIFALLTIHTTSTLTKIDLNSFIELSDLKGDSYAESLVQTINTALESSNGKVEKIQNLLKDLITNLNRDQLRSDSKWRNRLAFLNKAIEELKTDISRLSEKIAAEKKRKSFLLVRISKGIQNIKTYKIQLGQDVAVLNQLALRRHDDRRIYIENSNNHQGLIDAVNQVISALRNLIDSIAGVNRPSHVKAFSGEERDQAWKRAHSALLQIFTVDEANSLLSLETKADQQKLRELISQLNGLKISAERSLVDDEEAEKKSEKIFKELTATLNRDIETLRRTIKKQRINNKRYSSEVNSLSITIRTNSDLRAIQRRSLANTIESKRIGQLKYDHDKRQRNKEKRIIRRLQKIVNKRLANMNEYLKRNVNK